MKQNIPYVLRDTVTYKPFDWQSIMKMEPNVLSSGQPSGSVNTISLSRVVSDIHEYGIGYSDVISIIAFPLIIALFAFASHSCLIVSTKSTLSMDRLLLQNCSLVHGSMSFSGS